MQIFLIVSQPNPNTQRLPAAIENLFPQNNLLLSDGVWLIAGTGTPKEICDRLSITNGTNGAAVVTEVGAYYGFANRNIWNWLKVKGTETVG